MFQKGYPQVFNRINGGLLFFMQGNASGKFSSLNLFSLLPGVSNSERGSRLLCDHVICISWNFEVSGIII